jgi:membrane protein DedA with SNARE-associated domain
MRMLITVLYIGYGHHNVKLTEEEKKWLPFVWILFIAIVVGGLYLTYRSWKKKQNR